MADLVLLFSEQSCSFFLVHLFPEKYWYHLTLQRVSSKSAPSMACPGFPSILVPQLVAAIAELQSQGYNVPDFRQEPTTDLEKEIK